jgi:putative nucleotidyltransferase with HDIG domain
MRKFILFLDKNSRLVLRVLLYFLTLAILLFIFPREGSFPYEFFMGKPWLHNDLYSTFDFPVRKSVDEINAEKDSILKEFKPYFNYKSNIGDEAVRKFDKSFDDQWNKFSDKQMEMAKSKEFITFFKNTDSTARIGFKKFAEDLLFKVYQKGVIEKNDQVENYTGKDFPLVIIRDNVGEEYEYSDVFTQKLAYEYIINQINALKDASPSDRILYQSGFYKELNINEFILPNLIYNEEASKNVKNELVKKVSLTKGMFLSDKRVIGKGEIVNAEKYNILQSLKYEYENRLGHSNKFVYVIIGQAIITSFLLLLLVIFLISFRREVYSNNLKFSFILFLLLIFVGIASFMVRKDWSGYIYILPFALLPMVVKTFYDSRLALFVHTVVILLVGFIVPNGFEFIFLNFITGAVSIIGLSNLYRRGKLFNSIFYVTASYWLLYFAIFLIQGNDLFDTPKDGNFWDYHSNFWNHYIYFGINGLLLLVAYPMIFIFEKMFGFLSDLTLMELSDTNQPLLRKLNEKAPGTFQHSLQVANLAEEAAYKIGANPLLVRTGALYHDIGKMSNPMYFIENLSTEKNPHDSLSNEASARIIIEHVTLGIEIARKHRLPEQITDFIRTHHGTTTVQFFYRTMKKQNPDNEVDISKFTYPGPIPFSKEMALVMIADSVEAASRSLKEINHESINDLVDNIIYYQMINEQYYNSNITLKDIAIVKEIFKRKLMNIYHVRVEYPDVI